ncbi:MAG: ergosterol biosynthesis protein [Gammaproteobacteria bacterium]|nr:ergosterol biosynthesis protein [Gammaproteobacteria bacterium]
MSDADTWQSIAGFLTPTAIFAILLILHVILPAKRVDGYAHHGTSGTPVRYRLNGIAVFVGALVIWWLELTYAPLGWLWQVKWHAMAGAVALSIVLTAWLVLRVPADERSTWVQWLEGRSRNVQFAGRVDVKMFMYIFGGTLLALNAVSSAAYHYGQHGDAVNIGLMLHAAMWVWFVADYFCFERVQLFTFDIFEERVGFKLIVGCIAVYPCLYPVALWGTAGLPAPEIDPTWNPLWLGGSAAIFLLGWTITRGANYQKYIFKRFPERAFLGLIKPATVTDGERKILCSGFWGAARHMNYTGEILEALGMALALGHFTNGWAWAYFVYLTVFFVTRDRIDDRRCEGKYGELWSQYRDKVPRRLVPGVY